MTTSRSSAAERIERAAKPAVDHADSVSPGWSDLALDLVREYAESNLSFIIEDVRLPAEKMGFQIPPSRRAWGGVALRAKRCGYIRPNGYAMSTSPDANPTPVTSWQSLIYRNH